MVLHDAPEEMALGQVARDARPAAAAVFTLQDVGLEVTGLVVVNDDVDGVRVVEVRLDVVDEESVRHTGQLVEASPGPAVVLRHLDQAIIGTDIDEPADERRLGKRRDRVELRHRPDVPG